MKKTTSRNLSKRLAQYGTLTLAIAGVSHTNGQIIYTDINPDEGGSGYLYLLDIDGSPGSDFGIRHFDSLTSSGLNYYNILAAGVSSALSRPNNAIFGYNAGNWQYPFALDSGVTISNAMVVSSDSNFGGTVFGAWVNDGFQTLNYNSCAWSFSNWCANSGDKFLGLKFEIAAQVHFGWARIEIGATAGDWLIRDYAYNSTPGAPINAGQKTLGIEDTNLSKVKIVALNKSIRLYNLPASSSYNLYNMIGQEVLKGTTNEREYVIEASSLASGIYIVELSDIESNAVLRKKIVL